MPLAIVNWNILYEAPRPSDSARFEKNGQPSLTEMKAATAALAFFCYSDNLSPSDQEDSVSPQDRQEVKLKIGGKDCVYYRGGSNAHVRMDLVKQNIQSLAKRADIVCLQEVTPKMAVELQKILKATHQTFYSYESGNNHGVMVIVKNEIEVEGTSCEVQIKNGAQARKVRVVDVRDPETLAIVRIAAAHFYGHNGAKQAVDKEASDLLKRLKALPKDCDAIAVGADVNELKRARESIALPAVHYAETDGAAGWQLNLMGQSKGGQVPVQAKPTPFGLCAIMLDAHHPSEPLDLSDLPEGLSDHAPIGTQITVPAARIPLVKQVKIIQQPPVIPVTPFQRLIAFCTRIWQQVIAYFAAIWRSIHSLFG